MRRRVPPFLGEHPPRARPQTPPPLAHGSPRRSSVAREWSQLIVQIAVLARSDLPQGRRRPAFPPGGGWRLRFVQPPLGPAPSPPHVLLLFFAELLRRPCALAQTHRSAAR